jgi:hypothetical protein
MFATDISTQTRGKFKLERFGNLDVHKLPIIDFPNRVFAGRRAVTVSLKVQNQFFIFIPGFPGLNKNWARKMINETKSFDGFFGVGHQALPL